MISLAHAQTCVFLIAEKKNLNLELRAQLCMGVYEFYNSALNLANDSLKKRISDITRSLLNFKRMYFSATSFLKMKDSCDEVFKKTGEQYGKQITYITLAIASLTAASKEFAKVSGAELENAKLLNGSLPNLKAEMIKKNNNMYYDHIPEISSIPKIEKIIKVNPLSIADVLNKGKSERTVLDDLIPKETRKLIDNYKQQVNEYISKKIDKEETDIKIAEYLKAENLPYNLDSTMGSEISEGLWKRFSEVQQKGGLVYLKNQISNVSSSSDEIKRRLEDLEVVLSSEREEDNRLRLLYGPKWVRQPSDILNKNYMDVLNDYKSKIK